MPLSILLGPPQANSQGGRQPAGMAHCRWEWGGPVPRWGRAGWGSPAPLLLLMGVRGRPQGPSLAGTKPCPQGSCTWKACEGRLHRRLSFHPQMVPWTCCTLADPGGEQGKEEGAPWVPCSPCLGLAWGNHWACPRPVGFFSLEAPRNRALLGPWKAPSLPQKERQQGLQPAPRGLGEEQGAAGVNAW